MPIGPWGRFNRTSFQQQLKLVMSSIFWSTFCSFNRTSFQQQLKLNSNSIPSLCSVLLQSYILSTTTETRTRRRADFAYFSLQSYILSTTTETSVNTCKLCCNRSFNRTSFQQQLKLIETDTIDIVQGKASIVHPFNNN